MTPAIIGLLTVAFILARLFRSTGTVSYTHLDVYKRQDLASISDEVKRIEFTTSDGRVMKQNFITCLLYTSRCV